jgi:hypothetical protein
MTDVMLQVRREGQCCVCRTRFVFLRRKTSSICVLSCCASIFSQTCPFTTATNRLVMDFVGIGFLLKRVIIYLHKHMETAAYKECALARKCLGKNVHSSARPFASCLLPCRSCPAMVTSVICPAKLAQSSQRRTSA